MRLLKNIGLLAVVFLVEILKLELTRFFPKAVLKLIFNLLQV